MAINTADWPYHLRIPIDYVPSSVTAGQVLTVTEATIEKMPLALQNLFWSKVKNGGGDLRVCENVDGSGQLPIEVVLCDTVSKKLIVWVRIASFDGSNVLHLFFKNDSASALPVANTYGQYAVWQDFEAVYHFRSPDPLVDATSNVRHLNSVGNATFNDGVIDSHNDFNNRLVATGYNGITGDVDRTVTFLSNPTQNSDYGITTWGASADRERWSVYFDNGAFRTEIQSSYHYTNSWTGDGNFKRFTSILSGNTFPLNHSLRINGTEITDTRKGSDRTVDTNIGADVIVNGFDNFLGDQFGGEELKELWYRAEAISPSKDKVETTNQTNEPDFYGVPSVFYGSEEIRAFTGAVSLSTTTVGESYKRSMLTANASISASTAGSFLKRVSVKAVAKIKAMVSGQATKKVPLAGSSSIKATTHATASKKSILSGVTAIKTFLTSRFYNKADNVETHTITIQGQLRESIEVKGFVNTNRN
ncbi:hypothetical protein ACQKDY_19885 [Alteromonas macleodii]|uniref:hypothetical protein n=1 Tax=Alteromonas macleodii TaxID=28108 RepID=UPI003CFC4186